MVFTTAKIYKSVWLAQQLPSSPSLAGFLVDLIQQISAKFSVQWTTSNSFLFVTTIKASQIIIYSMCLKEILCVQKISQY